jgi:glycosyltransferase involved in cell wall biosynthesis
MPPPKHIVLVHDWLVSMRGGERVLEALCELFPSARLFTLIHLPGTVSPAIERLSITTSFLQHLPFGRSHYQYYLPLFPAAVRSLNLGSADLVISSSSAAAKAVRTPPGALHLCYCHTPMRYLWDRYDDYFGNASLPVRVAMRLVRDRLRRWDTRTAAGVTHFIANSRFVQERIGDLYGRSSSIIYPPVDTDRFALSNRDEGYYLVVSALVPYKRIDLAIAACNALSERLVIVGSGSEDGRLRAMAGPTIEFAGRVADDAVRSHYEQCRALLFPGVEDFGIVPLEAMACGKPVIAFARGGACETVIDTISGILFPEQTCQSLVEAIGDFRRTRFDGQAIRAHALRFDKALFKRSLEQEVLSRWEMHENARSAEC